MTVNAINDFLANVSDRVSKALEIISQEDTPYKQMLHISANTGIKQFVPRISTRQMPSEDRTVARVVTSPVLYGCILAYQSMPSDYTTYPQKSAENDSPWKNGYMIYALNYEHCLKPNTSLVPDVKHTNETWLVGYSPETRHYAAVPAGRMFCTEIKYIPRPGMLPACDATIFVEVLLEDGIYFSKNIRLSKGYWKVESTIQDNESWRNLSWKADKEFTAVEITKQAWLDQKRSVAEMLSVKDKLPAYLGW